MNEILENLEHLSYSTAKKIYRKGVDYAVGTKLGLIDETFGKSADIGTIAHAILLGGDPQFIVNPFKDNFAKNEPDGGATVKEKREWKNAQTKMIISENDFAQISAISDAVLAHPLAKELLKTTNHEIELTAEIESLKFLGYADGISEDRQILFDLKTTAQFDDFKYQVFKKDYDLQASIYRLFAKNPNEAKYYFIVAESCAPFRVQIFGTSEEFFDHGDQKLAKSLAEFKKFREREGENDLSKVSFNIGETDSLLAVEELGDWSL